MNIKSQTGVSCFNLADCFQLVELQISVADFISAHCSLLVESQSVYHVSAQQTALCRVANCYIMFNLSRLPSVGLVVNRFLILILSRLLSVDMAGN